MYFRFPLFYFLFVIASSLIPSAHGQQSETSVEALDSTSFLGDTASIQNDFGKLPTTITAESLTLKTKERQFSYKGNVHVSQGEMHLTCKEIDGTYSDKNEITSIQALGDVKITKQDMEATSQRALYNAVASSVQLTDNPQLKQGESILTADTITIFLAENRSSAEGNVRVTFVKQEEQKSPQTATALATPSPIPSVSPETPPSGRGDSRPMKKSRNKSSKKQPTQDQGVANSSMEG